MKLVIDIPQTMIDELRDGCFGLKHNIYEMAGLVMNGTILEQEPKTGHWIVVPGMNEQCSKCGKFFPLNFFKDRPFEINYCPNCGAKMSEIPTGSESEG